MKTEKQPTRGKITLQLCNIKSNPNIKILDLPNELIAIDVTRIESIHTSLNFIYIDMYSGKTHCLGEYLDEDDLVEKLESLNASLNQTTVKTD